MVRDGGPGALATRHLHQDGRNRPVAVGEVLSYPPAVTRSPATRRILRHLGALRFCALAALGVLLGHDAVYAAGAAAGAPDAQFAVVGHRYWPAFEALVLLMAAFTGLAGLVALARLMRKLRGLPAPSTTARAGAGYASELFRLWPRLFLAVSVAFALQENVEHLAAGEALPGLWVLAEPSHPLTIAALVGVTGLLAAVGAWFRNREVALARRLRAARLAVLLGRRSGRAGRRRDVGWLSARHLLLARPDAGRAPPTRSAA